MVKKTQTLTCLAEQYVVLAKAQAHGPPRYVTATRMKPPMKPPTYQPPAYAQATQQKVLRKAALDVLDPVFDVLVLDVYVVDVYVLVLYTALCL